MPFIEYERKIFSDTRMAVVDQANAICQEYEAQGIDLTLRQLYYQFVARGFIPNAQREYDRLGKICTEARMAGAMDWDHLTDLTRGLKGLAHWSNPTAIMRAVGSQYRTDRWRDQETRVEVWIEKDAAVGVIRGVCAEEDVDYFSCRGYTSMSEMWNASQRILGYLSTQDVLVLHIGDHDPSGLDMTRDIRERLELFINTDRQDGFHEDARDHELKVRRIALNYDQVQQYNPPLNPAKTTDARFLRYVQETGLNESWELDALEPTVLQDLIRSHIRPARDDDQWAASTEAMQAERAHLLTASQRWDDVVRYLENGEGS